MEPKLRQYIEGLFAGAPNTKQACELKEEIIRNTIERYHDLIAEGKDSQQAYDLAVEGIGDINELLEALGAEPAKEESVTKQEYSEEQISSINIRRKMFKSLAVGLYIMCITPPIILDNTFLKNISPAMMFWMISIATGLLIYSGKTKYTPVMTEKDEIEQIRLNAFLKALAVGMYISCVTPCIIFSNGESIIFMFAMIAAATIIIIFSSGKNKSFTPNEAMKESCGNLNRQKKPTPSLYKVLVAVLWVCASLLYIYLTSVTGFVTVLATWMIFPIAAALQGLMKAVFDYVEAVK